jgi:hypothetical protein
MIVEAILYEDKCLIKINAHKGKITKNWLHSSPKRILKSPLVDAKMHLKYIASSTVELDLKFMPIEDTMHNLEKTYSGVDIFRMGYRRLSSYMY